MLAARALALDGKILLALTQARKLTGEACARAFAYIFCTTQQQEDFTLLQEALGPLQETERDQAAVKVFMILVEAGMMQGAYELLKNVHDLRLLDMMLLLFQEVNEEDVDLAQGAQETWGKISNKASHELIPNINLFCRTGIETYLSDAQKKAYHPPRGRDQDETLAFLSSSVLVLKLLKAKKIDEVSHVVGQYPYVNSRVPLCVLALQGVFTPTPRTTIMDTARTTARECAAMEQVSAWGALYSVSHSSKDLGELDRIRDVLEKGDPLRNLAMAQKEVCEVLKK